LFSTHNVSHNHTMNSFKNTFATLLALAALGLPNARAQYPRVPPDVQAEAKTKKVAADKRSDEAFEKALPTIKEWEAKDKPYLPGAAEPKDLPQAKIPSFPGAWGGGMYSFGGRGGKVFVVTNLNDSGPGSFRAACEAGGPRIVVFNVAGIIRLKSHLRVRAPYITIAGNTAPGDGVSSRAIPLSLKRTTSSFVTCDFVAAKRGSATATILSVAIPPAIS
jgi:hypothetical protein